MSDRELTKRAGATEHTVRVQNQYVTTLESLGRVVTALGQTASESRIRALVATAREKLVFLEELAREIGGEGT